MSGDDSGMLGLIAGAGTFPLDVARSARRAGRRVACVAFRDRTDPRIEQEVVQITWIHPGEVGVGVAAFRTAGVRDAVMAGKVHKADLLRDPEALRLDERAEELMGQVQDRSDDTILGKVADFLETLGIRLLPQGALVPELLAGEGPLGKARPTARHEADIAFGLPVAKKLGELDIGQTVVVKDRAVLAVEAIEGTDAALRRAGALAPGGVAVKVAKPRQDPRFDMPAIGLETVRALVEARIEVLAFEAGATLVLEREELVRVADAHEIAVVGVDPRRFESG
ncbi:MAG TPA: UDP-2,3-diacylglucosamine diphosphatase LpxI [Myxococcota bacterium]